MFTATATDRSPRWIARLTAHVAITGALTVALLMELEAGTGSLEHGLLIGAGLLIYKGLRPQERRRRRGRPG